MTQPFVKVRGSNFCRCFEVVHRQPVNRKADRILPLPSHAGLIVTVESVAGTSGLEPATSVVTDPRLNAPGRRFSCKIGPVLLAKRPIQYDAGYTLFPGRHTIKVLARDDETGRIGTFQTTFTVPSLMRETQRIPLSSVVLGSQRLSVRDALYNAGGDKKRAKAGAVNPLVQDGQKLIPNVTHVFSKARPVYIYLEAYEPAGAATTPLTAYVTLYREGSKVFETTPLDVTHSTGGSIQSLPIAFTLNLDQHPPGFYDGQITALDITGRKTAFARTTIALVP